MADTIAEKSSKMIAENVSSSIRLRCLALDEESLAIELEKLKIDAMLKGAEIEADAKVYSVAVSTAGIVGTAVLVGSYIIYKFNAQQKLIDEVAESSNEIVSIRYKQALR